MRFFNRRSFLSSVFGSASLVVTNSLSLGSLYNRIFGFNECSNTLYRNVNIQVRKNKQKDFYWETRPFGNPNPKPACDFEGFVFEKVTFSNDELTKTVETIWDSKESFLNALPPEHFEQPGFDQWHSQNGVGFSYTEEYINADEYASKNIYKS